MTCYFLTRQKLIFFVLISFVAVLFLSACAARKPWYNKNYDGWSSKTPPDSADLVNSVLLVGDAGKVDDDDPVMLLLRNQLFADNNEDNAVVFLGDNVYPAGLPEEDNLLRGQAESRLIAQMKAVKGAPAWAMFIPGNHDWNDQGKGGLIGIKREAEFINAYMESDSSFYPRNGCPGPVVVHPHPNLALVLIDTEWWLHKYEKPIIKEAGCEICTEEDVVAELERIVNDHADKHILIGQHHPFFTNGNHGGYFETLDHIFPLRSLNRDFFIPLPVLGTIYAVLRRAGISAEDVRGKPYKAQKKAFLQALAGKKEVIISAGHEHILQYNQIENVHHILSGTGAKVSYGRKGKGAAFVHMERGYARVNYYRDGAAWVEYWEPGGKLGEGILIFRHRLYGPEE